MSKTTIEMKVKFTQDEDVRAETPRFYRFFKDHDITLLGEEHCGQTVIFEVDCNNKFIDSLTDLVDVEELGIESATFEIDLKPMASE